MTIQELVKLENSPAFTGEGMQEEISQTIVDLLKMAPTIFLQTGGDQQKAVYHLLVAAYCVGFTRGGSDALKAELQLGTEEG